MKPPFANLFRIDLGTKSLGVGVYLFREMRVPAGHVCPLAQHPVQRQGDKTCKCACLHFSLSHAITQCVSVSLAGQQLPAGKETLVGLVNTLRAPLIIL